MRGVSECLVFNEVIGLVRVSECLVFNEVIGLCLELVWFVVPVVLFLISHIPKIVTFVPLI